MANSNSTLDGRIHGKCMGSLFLLLELAIPGTGGRKQCLEMNAPKDRFDSD